LVGEIRDILSQTIREYGLIRRAQAVPAERRGTRHARFSRDGVVERGATRVTTSVNPKQSTGQPAG